MKPILMSALISAVLLMPAGAANANELVLLNEDGLSNHALATMEGSGNRLEIVQQHTGGLGANSIIVAIHGDLNGGPLGASFSGAATRTGLQPGRLMQEGFNNAMTIAVNGSGNLFAASQIGSGNSLRGSITGNANQAAVMQTGIGNHAGFSQNGTGNIVSIVQRSW